MKSYLVQSLKLTGRLVQKCNALELNKKRVKLVIKQNNSCAYTERYFSGYKAFQSGAT